MKRFYKNAAAGPADSGFHVLLDERAMKTQGAAKLLVPSRRLADAIASEWHEVSESVDPHAMPLTRLAFAAIDSVKPHRDQIIETIAAFGDSDLLSYRADNPKELVARQARAWDPLLDWSAQRHRARLRVTTGILHIAQPEEARAALRSAVAAHDDFTLAALHIATAITGSLVIALALSEGRLGATEAFAAATIDEAWQAEKWGQDEEAQTRLKRHQGELAAAERFLRLLA
jgi:chaperone required for assembly of F1-ATPase